MSKKGREVQRKVAEVLAGLYDFRFRKEGFTSEPIEAGTAELCLLFP